MIPVLWLCGPPGVGKTTVAWRLYSELVRSGVETAYVDIDQLGICYPEPATDPGRHRMKARNLAAVVAGHRAAGARCVVVSGVVDAVGGVPVEHLPRVALTVCRLRAGHDELRRRLASRLLPDEQVAETLRHADDLDAGGVGDVCVDTTGRSAAEVVRLVRESTGGWPAPTGPGAEEPGAEEPGGHADDGSVLWLCGATAVGKSAVGFAVYGKVLRTSPAAYVDVDQIGHRGPTPADHRVRARVLAAMWRTYRAAGARRLVVVGPVEDEAALAVYTDALPAATVTVCRLHAGREQLTRRLLLRGQGGGWPQPGDPLRDRPVRHLLGVADRATADAEALERAALGLRVDTDSLTVEEAADEVLARSGWPDR